MGAEVRNLYVVLSAKATDFRGQMVGAGQSVRQFGDETMRVSKENDHFRDGLAKTSMLLGGAVIAGLAAGVYWNVQLEKQMRNVATISDEVGDNLGHYSDQIRLMAAELPQTTAQLADGFYDIVSSGYDGQEALDILRISAMSAAAGLTDTAVSAQATLTVLNAYGLGATAAADVSDTLFQAVNKGIMTYEQLASSIGSVVPTAAAARVSFDETASALAAITLNGLTADEAATSLNNTIAKILIPSDAMAAALADLGYESGGTALATDGLYKVITRLAESQGTAADTAFRLFPEIRAARGYMALTSAEGKNYASTFDSISDKVERAQATQRAYNTQAESDAATWDRIIGNVQSNLMGAAQGLMPVFGTLSDFIEDLTGMIGAIPAPVMSLAGQLGGLLGIVLLLSGGYLKAYKSIQSFRDGLTSLTGTARIASAAVKGLQISMGIVGVALAAATLMYGAYTAGKQEAKAATDDFVAALQAESDGVEDAALSAIIKKMVDDGSIDKMKKAGVDLGTVIRGITGSTSEWGTAQEELDTKLRPLAHEAEVAQKKIDELDSAYQAGKISADDYGTQVMALSSAVEENAVKGTEQQKVYGDVLGSVSLYRDAMLDAKEVNLLTAEAQDTASRAVLQHASGLARLEAFLQPVKDGERQVAESTKLLQAALDGARDPMQALTAATDDGRVSFEKFVASMEQQVRDMGNYANNLALLAARGRTDLVDEFVKMGPEAAGLVAEAVGQSDKELDHLARVFGEQATQSTVAFEQGLNALPAIAADKGKLTVKQLAAGFTGGDAKAAVAMLQVLRDSIQSIPLKHKIDLILEQHGDVEGKAKSIAGAYNKLPKDVRTQLGADGIPKTMADILKLQTQYDLTDRQILTILSARDNASIVITDVSAKLKNLDGNRATVYVTTIRKGTSVVEPHANIPKEDNADGGLYVGGRRFADGGFGGGGRYYAREPQIVAGGANVLWGEKETGWEAYISGKPSQLSRNRQIWAEAGHRLGIDPGARGRSAAGGGGGARVVVQQVQMPERLELVLDSGQRLGAYVRGHAKQVVDEQGEVGERAGGSHGRMSW